MAKLTYKLRSNKDNSAVIQLVFNYGSNKRLRYSTGLYIQRLKNWDKNKMRVKRVVEEIDSYRTNNILNELQSYIEKEYYKLLENSDYEINNDNLKELCNIFFGKKDPIQEKEHINLIPFYLWFIDNYSVNPTMSSGKPLKKGTAKTYKNAYNIIKRFNDEVYQLSYDKIGHSFYQDFLGWLHENNYSTNYVGAQIKILKTMMNASLELNYHTNNEHNKKYFKKPTEDVYHIYLNQKELNKIEGLDFSNIESIKISKYLLLTPEKLDVARDLFLIAANTGLRVSDFNRLEQKNIINLNNKQYFTITPEKTERPLTIPINPIVSNILKKRNGFPPKPMPDQHINYALKEIGKLAKINNEEIVEKTVGGVLTKFKHKKHELITNHTGRRSFCTNAYLSGMPTIDIMAISGHSTEKVFYSYIKVSHLERAVKIAEHDFFN